MRMEVLLWDVEGERGHGDKYKFVLEDGMITIIRTYVNDNGIPCTELVEVPKASLGNFVHALSSLVGA